MQTREHVAWSLDIALQLARGSAEMHRIRLVHRDLKPQNVMLVGDRVVLIDFGFARRDGVTTMTQTGTAIGTLAYMSPELLSGESANERLDVYALGATIYHCLTGAPPFGSTEPTLKAMAGRGRPRSARSANPAVDVGLAAVVARCLEPDPRDRYLDAEAVLMDLERVQRGERVRIPFSLGRLWRHRRRRCLQVAGLAAALLLASWVPHRSGREWKVRRCSLGTRPWAAVRAPTTTTACASTARYNPRFRGSELRLQPEHLTWNCASAFLDDPLRKTSPLPPRGQSSPFNEPVGFSLRRRCPHTATTNVMTKAAIFSARSRSKASSG